MPVAVRVDAAKFLQSWGALANRIDAYGFSAWKAVLAQSEESMHEHHYQNKTGKLTASMQHMTGRGRRFGWNGNVTVSAPYAVFVNEGTAPHEILPKRAGGLLRFYWPKIGAWVALPRVWHPGTYPAGFVTRAQRTFLDNQRRIQDAVDSAIRE